MSSRKLIPGLCFSLIVLLVWIQLAKSSLGFISGGTSAAKSTALRVQRRATPSPSSEKSSKSGADESNQQSDDQSRRSVLNTVVNSALAVYTAYICYKFTRLPKQYIAALGNPSANSGSGAEKWGVWVQDPGPRGVRLSDYKNLSTSGGTAPAGWKFDASDWWLEEHGLIMEQPSAPLPPGRYTVTGDREVTTQLTIHEKDQNGEQRWELGDSAKLYDVTHLPCRSARYTPTVKDQVCLPSAASSSDFPVTPGGPMPPVTGCQKQDYAVLFVLDFQPPSSK
eukprot:TRINITY_DN100485_c0_g1_i1.p1 TRINITY_DN100485_c0_g1~~TRINITY_DN100485_c0_g1_i1.p1  ORF type:complete len:281 (+),score=19.77 TRINITY_DN100485_c0_g1_i1:76-918(+)